MKKEQAVINKGKAVIAVSAVAILVTMCGCAGAGGQVSEADVQRSGQSPQAYVAIEDEEVPMAAMPIALDAVSEENETEATENMTPQATAETTAEPSKEPMVARESEIVKDVPETEEKNVAESSVEVEVQLEAKIPQVEVAVETKQMQENVFDAGIFAQEVCAAMNETRAASGLSPLSTTPELTQAANKRAAEIASKFSHTRPGDKDYQTAVTEAGGSFGYIGENLFRGMSTADAAKSAWEASQVHMDNILCSNFHHVGIGVAVSGEQVYMVQVFTD